MWPARSSIMLPIYMFPEVRVSNFIQCVWIISTFPALPRSPLLLYPHDFVSLERQTNKLQDQFVLPEIFLGYTLRENWTHSFPAAKLQLSSCLWVREFVPLQTQFISCPCAQFISWSPLSLNVLPRECDPDYISSCWTLSALATELYTRQLWLLFFIFLLLLCYPRLS